MSARQSAKIDERAGLAPLLERDPGRFEPTTAFRAAQAATPRLEVSPHIGVSPAILPLDGFRREKNGQAVAKSAFPNLLGPAGALPPAYNEMVLREERNRSRALTSFFGLFSARVTELFVDACEKYRIARLLRWHPSGHSNGFLKTLFSLTGFGTARLRETAEVDEALILRFSGFFAARTRNAANLEAMLREFSGLPVRVELFRGRWLQVPENEQSRMQPGQGPRLGENAMAGAMIRDFTGGFRVVIGPLDYADYLALTPGKHAAQEIFSLTRLFVGSGLDFDVQIILKREHIPFCRIGGPGEQPRLGWNSWARAEAATKDGDEAIITRSSAFQKEGA